MLQAVFVKRSSAFMQQEHLAGCLGCLSEAHVGYLPGSTGGVLQPFSAIAWLGMNEESESI